MATSYQLICSVELLHAYFVNDVMQNVGIHPDDGTRAILQQYDLKLRLNLNKLEIYGNSHTLSGIPFDDLPRLAFYIMVEDPYFYNYTQLPIDQNKKVYVFENQPEKTSLSKQEFVSDEDITTEDHSTPAQVFGQIYLTLTGAADEVPTYQLKFEARSIIWRYYIINNSSTEVAIVSINVEDSPSAFIDKGVQPILNGQQAHVMESDPQQPIVMKEQYSYALSLKISVNDRASSIRLPYPSAQQLKKVETEEGTLFYSDMYIYI